MKIKAIHNGYCLTCKKESIRSFCNRKCYLDYVRSNPILDNRKGREKKYRDELTDRVVKRTIYIQSKRSIKWSDITSDMVIEKKAKILEGRRVKEERKTNPPVKPKKGRVFRGCIICGKEYEAKGKALVCGNECRKVDGRKKYYADHENNLEKGRIRDSVRVTPKHEVVCGECGKVFMQEYRNTRSTYCSDRCMKRNCHRNYKHKRRMNLATAFIEPVYKAMIFKRDNGRCQICGKKVATKQKAPHPYSASLDHIIPLAKGGMHEPKNVRLVHLICNSIKSDGVSYGGDQLILFG